MSEKLLVKRLSPQATIPKKGSQLAAGYDLYSASNCVIPPYSHSLISTDISILIPEGTYARVAPRSGLALKYGINTGAGVIDRDYSGPVGVILFNHTGKDFHVNQGDRIAQLILERIVENAVVEEVTSLNHQSERGSNGFGSTGV